MTPEEATSNQKPTERLGTSDITKKNGGVISTSLKNLFNNSKRLRKFPTAQKIGIVSPTFKEGDRKEVSDYRPVTLWNIISKKFEKMFSSHC